MMIQELLNFYIFIKVWLHNRFNQRASANEIQKGLARDTMLRIVYLNLYAFWIVILGKWDSLTSTVVESSLRITVADENSSKTLDYKFKLYKV